AGKAGYGIDPGVLAGFAVEMKEVHALGVEIALVIGGGNIFRGLQASAQGIDRATADYMGMLATVTRSRCKMRSKRSGFRRASSRQSRCRRSRSPISDAARPAIWRRVGW